MNEKEYTEQKVIPILKNLGFYNVRYTGGTKEFGKDIVFYDYNRIGTRINYAAQVKMGKLSGKVGADVNEIVEQIEMAFEHPYKDILSKDDQYISELFVIVYDGYTNNAEERILKKIANKPHQNNITFLDNDLLLSMEISIHFYKNIESSAFLKSLLFELKLNLKIASEMRININKSNVPYHDLVMTNLNKGLEGELLPGNFRILCTNVALTGNAINNQTNHMRNMAAVMPLDDIIASFHGNLNNYLSYLNTLIGDVQDEIVKYEKEN